MADGYWNRQAQISAPGFVKRPRTEYEMPPPRMPSAHQSYATMDDHGGSRAVKDTKEIGSAYDRYLQNQLSSISTGEPAYSRPAYSRPAIGKSSSSAMSGHLMADHSLLGRYGVISDHAPNGRGSDSDIHRTDAAKKSARGTLPLPRDASNTIYVEGLPSDCTKREVAHIFRPFVGYREVRLVTKDSKHRGGDPLILCFVDFVDAACTATAMSALQGYKMDENDPDSRSIRLEFSRNPGPRSSTSSRGR